MPDVLLITLDTTRVDRIGVYGYSGGTTPNLDRFAERAMVYTRAVSTASWTYPAHASLFTGKFPTSHGARYDPRGSLLLSSAIGGPPHRKLYRARRLAVDERTLAGILSDAGYRTGAIVAGPWLKRIMGLDVGFDHYDDTGIDSMNGRIAPDVTDHALAWVREDSSRPFFLFVNYFDPHGPFRAPEEFERPHPADAPDSPNPRSSRGYDAEIRFMDQHLGRLFDALRALGRFDDAWIVITGDHGELLGEHGIVGHGNALYEELIRIPLIVKAPGADPPAGRSEVSAQSVDVFATILDALGLDPPSGIQGQPLGRVDHPLVSELKRLEFMEGRVQPGDVWRGDLRVLYDGRYKLIWSGLGRHQLFDVIADPQEQEDRSATDADVVASMQEQLHAYLDALPEPAPDEREPQHVDAETEASLRELGYLE